MANSSNHAIVQGELQPGTRVEVLSRFDSSWARGFEVAETATGRYRLRRLSDGAVLPADFAAEDIRLERERRTAVW